MNLLKKLFTKKEEESKQRYLVKVHRVRTINGKQGQTANWKDLSKKELIQLLEGQEVTKIEDNELFTFVEGEGNYNKYELHLDIYNAKENYQNSYPEEILKMVQN